MNESLPAAVYAPCLSTDGRAALKQSLLERNLYISDHAEERPDDLNLPPQLRPQLVRRVVHLEMGWASTLVVDHISNLGRTLPEQLAVLGYALDLSVTVLVDGEDQISSYQSRVGALSTQESVELWQVRTCVEAWRDTHSEVLTRAYGTVELAADAVFADTLNMNQQYSYGEACLLADKLLREGMSAKAIAQVLLVDGYENKRLRHVWYHGNAQRAVDDTQAQQAALAAREARALKLSERAAMAYETDPDPATGGFDRDGEL